MARNGCCRLLAVFSALASTTPLTAVEEKRVVVVLRYDDYSARPKGRAIDRRVLQTLKDCGVPCTVSVIPYVCAENSEDPRPQMLLPLEACDAEPFLDPQGRRLLEAALHGYAHQAGPAGPSRGEFAGMPPAEQARRIQRGREHLEGLFGKPVTTFVPPWNTYEGQTLDQLAAQGLRTLSGNAMGPDGGESRLKVVPATCALATLRNAVKAARLSADPAPVVVALFHSYDFLECDPKQGQLDLRQFRELMQWLAAQPDVSLATVGQLAEARPDLDFANFRRFRPCGRLLECLPPPLRRRYLFYPSPSDLPRFQKGVLALAAIWFVGVWIASVVTLRCAAWLPLRRRHAGVLLAGVVVVGVLALVRGLVLGRFSYVSTALVAYPLDLVGTLALYWLVWKGIAPHR